MKKFYNGREIKVIREFTFEKIDYAVIYYPNDWHEPFVIKTDRIEKEEEQELYKLQQEIKRLRREKAKEIKKIQDKAIKSLSARVRFNMAFGKGNNAKLQAGSMIVRGLKKLIEEEK